jgi:hypothetical protein
MKRDFDLIRCILIQAEVAPAGGPWLQHITYDVDGYTQQTIAQHVALMAEFGLFEAKVPSVVAGMYAIGPLTWEGYDFLETARNATAWNKVMTQVKAAGLAMTLAVVKGLLSKEALRLAGLS